MYIPKKASFVLDILNKNGYDAYLVGGCVRDSIMGKTPNDYDITTNASPEKILECFSSCKTLTNGIKHGTVGVVVDKEIVEVTTYRIDGEYTDNRHPDKVVFSEKLTDDLSRRDFTVNAIAYGSDMKFCDPFGGISDIERRIIKCVGEPDKRFKEDALRILRALRFSSVLDFDIDSETALYVHKNAKLLENVSFERINAEFSKLICGIRAEKILSDYSDVIAVFIPQINVFDKHEICSIAKSVGCSGSTLTERLCVFLGSMLDFEKTNAVMTALKYDNVTKRNVCNVVRVIDTEFNNDRRYIKRVVSKYGFDTSLLLCKTKRSLGHWNENQCDEFEKTVKGIKENGECVSVSQLAINGNDCIREFKVSGSIVGSILDMLCNAVIDGRINNEYNELLSAADSYIKQLETPCNE